MEPSVSVSDGLASINAFFYKHMIDCVRIHIYGLIQLFSILILFGNGELHSSGWMAMDRWGKPYRRA